MSGAAQSAPIADEAVVDFLDDSDIAAADSGVEQEIANSPGVFCSIGEAAAELELPAHVLRYWETQFGALQPLKRTGGRRYYRPADIAFLKLLRSLLHEQGYTIRGVQRLLGGVAGVDAAQAETPDAPERFTLPIGEDMTPQALQAFVAQAAEAGSFGPAPSDAPVAQLVGAADHSARLHDALDLLLKAKSRLDAVRRRA